MVKVSISLPNNTQITFESDEAEVLREVVALALRDLPRDLLQATTVDDARPASAPAEKSNIVAASASPDAKSEPEPESTPAAEPPEEKPAAAPVTMVAQVASEPSSRNGHSSAEMPPELRSDEGRRNFVAFCQEANPMGDMRRVVVAVEGASRHFGSEGVNATDLGWLFEMAGWRRPGDFTQTLRNAARSKFGWLERIPGRSGRYAATPLGLSKTLSG